MNSIRALCFASLFALGLASEPAQAGLLLDLQTGGAPSVCGSCGTTLGETFGWGFTVNRPVSVDGIGLWDANSDGFGGAQYQLGLFTGAGTLLSTATISDTSTPVASASADGRWMFESIAPQTLGIGDYLIGGAFFDADPFAQIGAPFVTNPNISGVDARFNSTFDGGLLPPTESFTFPIFGPTLRTVGAVPEPETAPLLLAGLVSAGLLSFGTRKRKR